MHTCIFNYVSHFTKDIKNHSTTCQDEETTFEVFCSQSKSWQKMWFLLCQNLSRKNMQYLRTKV